MAQVDLRGTQVLVTFTKWERLFTRRKALHLPMATLSQVKYVPRPLREVQGAKSGLLVTGLLKVGVWSGKRIVSVRRGVPALRLILPDGNPYKEVIVSTPSAAELAVEIRPGVPHP